MGSAEEFSKKQRELIDLFGRAPIRKLFGMSLSYDEEGRARFDLPYNPQLDHALGGTHGGAIATLLDNAGWFTVAPHFDTWIVTVEFGVKLIEPVQEEDLYSLGRMIRAGGRIAFAEMEVRTAKGRLIATGTGTFSATSVSRTP